MKIPFTFNPPPACEGARQKPARRAGFGFTLVELLVVMVIAAILMAMLGGAYMTARNHAKRARAETQLRELVKAWNQYYTTYGQWPNGYNNETKEMNYDSLQPLLANNLQGIPFLSIKIQQGEDYNDPWGNHYKISFKSPAVAHESALRISVGFPNRDRYRE